MPLYTYKCDECGKRFDKLTHHYDDVISVCKYCSGTATRISFYSPNIQTGGTSVPRGDPEWTDAAKKALKKDRDWDYDRALEHIHDHIVETDKGKTLDVETM